MRMFAAGLLLVVSPNVALCNSLDNSGAVQAQLVEIRIQQDAPDADRCSVWIKIRLTNRSSTAYCVLPSQANVNYNIRYTNGKGNAAAWGSQSISTKAKRLSDLDISSVLLPPFGSAAFEVRGRTYSLPNGSAGDLRMSIQMRPYFGDSSYRGVRLYREPLDINERVEVEYRKKTHDWLIKPEGFGVSPKAPIKTGKE